MGRRILFVHGLDPTTSAKELAREFERYYHLNRINLVCSYRIGPVRRCDIPAFSSRADSIYGFVEMESSRDADIAYRDLHGKRFLDGSIKIQWAKSIRRRDERRRRSLSPDDRRRRRSASPPRGRSRSPARMRSRSRSRSPSPPLNNNYKESGNKESGAIDSSSMEANALDWGYNYTF